MARIAGGTALGYSTYLGGRDPDAAYGVAATCYGVVHVVGDTSSTGFPLKSAADDDFHPSGNTCNSFLTRLDFGPTCAVDTLTLVIPRVDVLTCQDCSQQLAQHLRDRLLEARRAVEANDRPAAARTIEAFVREVRAASAADLPAIFREVAAELEAAGLDVFP